MTIAQTQTIGKYQSAADSAYLAELNDRISVLRSLHKQMARRDKTINWFKRLPKKYR